MFNMKLANARLLIGLEDSDIPLFGVTPAEVLILVKERGPRVGKCPVKNIQEIGEAKVFTGRDEEGRPTGARARSEALELDRLRMKYGEKIVAKHFPGTRPSLPETFEEALGAMPQVDPEKPERSGGYLFGDPSDYIKGGSAEVAAVTDA